MLARRAFDFFEIGKRLRRNQPQHSVSLVGLQLTTFDEGAHSLPRKPKDLACFGNSVELVGNHCGHALIVTAINRRIK